MPNARSAQSREILLVGHLVRSEYIGASILCFKFRQGKVLHNCYVICVIGNSTGDLQERQSGPDRFRILSLQAVL